MLAATPVTWALDKRSRNAEAGKANLLKESHDDDSDGTLPISQPMAPKTAFPC